MTGVGHSFERQGGMEIEAISTLWPAEIIALGLGSTAVIINVCEMIGQQLPKLYAPTHGLLCLSLKELGSVTSLADMIDRRSVLAWNRSFVWDSSGLT